MQQSPTPGARPLSQKSWSHLAWSQISWSRILLLALLLPCALYVGSNAVARYLLKRMALSTGPNGPATPATLGIPFERTVIPRGGRHLDSYTVTAPASCVDPPVLLVYHGVNETISNWVRAQRYLYNHCVSSLIFDATGSGDSSRPASFHAVRQDSVSAYEFTLRKFPGRRIYVLGHSMGNGPMLDAEPHYSTPPAGVIVANAFLSLRAYGGIRHNPLYLPLSYAIPDIWNNVKAVEAVHVPVLVIHSESDEVNPVSAGRAIFAAANQPKALDILHGFNHNALSGNPTDAWWSGALTFMNK